MKIDLKNDIVTMTGDDYNRLFNAWEENDSMINEMVMLKAKVNRLERENGQFIHDNNQLLHENRALRLQADTYFEKWQNAKKRIEELESEIDDRNEWDLLKMEQEDI